MNNVYSKIPMKGTKSQLKEKSVNFRLSDKKMKSNLKCFSKFFVFYKNSFTICLKFLALVAGDENCVKIVKHFQKRAKLTKKSSFQIKAFTHYITLS